MVRECEDNTVYGGRRSLIVTMNFGAILPIEDRFLVQCFGNDWYFAGLGS